MQYLVIGNCGLGKLPHGRLDCLLPNQEVEIPLTLPVQAFHVAFAIARVEARRGRLILVASELFQVLSSHSGTWRKWVVRTKSGAKSPAVAFAFLQVELGLEERARFEVELMREGVVQRALDAGLVGVVGAFEGRRRTGENGRTIEDDRGA